MTQPHPAEKTIFVTTGRSEMVELQSALRSKGYYALRGSNKVEAAAAIFDEVIRTLEREGKTFEMLA